MKRLTTLSTRRDRDYDYSQPGKHYIVFRTKRDAGILGTKEHGVTTLSDSGRAFLDVLGQALQNFPCISLPGMNIRPSEVHLALEITGVRRAREVPIIGSDEWVYYRRTMTLPMFMGYLKMNSGHRINTLLGKAGGDVWARRYASRVLRDEEELAAICAGLHEEWCRVVVSPPQVKKEKRAPVFGEMLALEFGGKGADTVHKGKRRGRSAQFSEVMFLGRVLLLTGARRDAPSKTSAGGGVARGGGSGGKAFLQGSVIRILGPDRIYLSE